jgi:ADP-ribosylglycohydrolase
MSPRLDDRIAGALYGGAIGDAMGAPVEKWPADQIAERFNDMESFIPPTHGLDPATGKGDGRFTDDTLMTEALIRAYNRAQDHLDAYGFETFMLPEMAEVEVWVPERQRTMPIVERLFWPEKYPWIRLFINNAEPRTAGVGNRVNCGAAMYIMPVGAVNAGFPGAAYQEAASFASAHNESYAVEAAAVMAAAVAAALAPDATIDRVLETALNLAQDGTKKAIAAVLGAVSSQAAREEFITTVRRAIRPFDQRYAYEGPSFSATGVKEHIGRPSRDSSIEELPVGLAALKYGNGDFSKTLSAAVFYGRDTDSSAGMACALFGAIYGVAALPERLRRQVDEANRRNLTDLAVSFTATIRTIFAKDWERYATRREVFR